MTTETDGLFEYHPEGPGWIAWQLTWMEFGDRNWDQRGMGGSGSAEDNSDGGWNRYENDDGWGGVHHSYQWPGTYDVVWHFQHMTDSGPDAETTRRMTVTVSRQSPSATVSPSDLPSSSPSSSDTPAAS